MEDKILKIRIHNWSLLRESNFDVNDEAKPSQLHQFNANDGSGSIQELIY